LKISRLLHFATFYTNFSHTAKLYAARFMNSLLTPFKFRAIYACAVALFSVGGHLSICAKENDSSPPQAEAALQKIVDEAYDRVKSDHSGKNADYIPYLASVPSNLCGVVIETADGHSYAAGDVDYSFAIESVAKPFTMCLVIQEQGDQAIVAKVGVEPTGLPFNSVRAVEEIKSHTVNPLVNAGAIATVSLVKASSADERWNKILDFYSKFAGAKLSLNNEVYKSEAATNEHNRGIAELLFSYNRLYSDPLEACDIYTRECSVNVTAKQLAVMGATLANGGVNPITGERVLDSKYIPKVLSVMLTAGFYNESGLWSWNTGLPAKTGVGGGILAVVPGKKSIVGFGPPLDESGNSIRAADAIRFIADQLNLSLFGSGTPPN
jgi:glutaminase